MLSEFQSSLNGSANRTICYQTDGSFNLAQLKSKITYLKQKISVIDAKSWLLSSENSFEFLAGFIALLDCKKAIVICANQSPAYLEMISDGFQAVLSTEQLSFKSHSIPSI